MGSKFEDPDSGPLALSRWPDAESLIESELERAGDSGPLLDPQGDAASIAAVFDALAGFLGPAAQRHAAQRLEVVAGPGEPLTGQVEPGDIILGRAYGEGGLAWADTVNDEDLDEAYGEGRRRRGRPIPARARRMARRRMAHNAMVVRPRLRRAPAGWQSPPIRRPAAQEPAHPVAAAEPPGPSMAAAPPVSTPPEPPEPVAFAAPPVAEPAAAPAVAEPVLAVTEPALPTEAYDLLVPVLPEPVEEEDQEQGQVSPEEEDSERRPAGRLRRTTAPAGPPPQCAGLTSPTVFDNFTFDGDQVLPAHRPQLRRLAECIVASLSTPSPINNLDIVGHTDPVGSEAYNLDLGRRRARNFKTALIAEINTVLPGAAAGIVMNDSSRGETVVLPGQPPERQRRVEVHFRLPVAPPTPTAAIEIVEDHDNDFAVDQRSPAATFVRFGLWDNAYDDRDNVRNGQAERDNFVGSDERRFYFRVRDAGATRSTVTINWKTLRADRRDDDAPASQELTLTESPAGSKVFVSKAVMLVTDDTDANQRTHSGFAATGLRSRGQSDHRLRRASMDGFVRGEYTPASGGRPVIIELPLFQRRPTDDRRKVTVRVINYGNHGSAAQIRGEFEHANRRWNQVGIRIEAGATVDRAIPAGMLNADGEYPGGANSANERAALADLVPITPDNTVTAVWVQCDVNQFNAYATIAQRTTVALGDRYFIFIDPDLDLDNETLAHELHHVLFNRFDGATSDHFYTLNTNAPVGRLPVPDTRFYRRIQDLHTADPDNDPRNDNIVNWARRRRGARFPIGGSLDAPTATTGNKLVESV